MTARAGGILGTNGVGRRDRTLAPLGTHGPDRRDRTLAPFPGADAVRPRRSDPRDYAFRLGFVAIILTFSLPSSLLVYLGLYSDAPGGSVLTKFHPATYVAAFGAWIALHSRRRGGGMTELFRERPALASSVALIVLCTVYSVISVGLSGAGVYIETFLAAAFAAIALEVGTERQRRILGYTIVTFSVINVAIALMEGGLQTHLMPEPPAPTDSPTGRFVEDVYDFRSQAFYPHPLTGALVTSMALIAVLGMRLRGWLAATVFAVFMVGLMSFGGRGALFATLFIIIAAALFQFASGLATRRLNVGFLGAFIAGVFLLPAVLVALTTMTSVGMRIQTHLYLDESADVRFIQWRVLSLLDFRDILFGVPLERVDLFKAQLGLLDRFTDIENPWLLTFLNLGVIGFPFLIAALFLFLWHLGRRANTSIGWLLITATLLICSTENSLGRKTPDLVFLAGFMVALSGFRSEHRQTAAMTAPLEDPASRTALATVSEVRVRTLSDGPEGGRKQSALSGRG